MAELELRQHALKRVSARDDVRLCLQPPLPPPDNQSPAPRDAVLPMQAVARAPGQQQPVKIYNAVYSSVQVRYPLCSLLTRYNASPSPGLRMHGPRYRCHAQAR